MYQGSGLTNRFHLQLYKTTIESKLITVLYAPNLNCISNLNSIDVLNNPSLQRRDTGHSRQKLRQKKTFNAQLVFRFLATAILNQGNCVTATCLQIQFRVQSNWVGIIKKAFLW